MAFREIGRQEYDLALASFRERPGGYAAAGRAAGIDKRTARDRLWLLGLPDLGLEPISQIIAREQQARRAAVVVEERKRALEQAVAAEDSAMASMNEALIARSARAAAAELLVASAHLRKFASKLAERVQGTDPATVAPQEAIRMVGAISRLTGRAIEAAEMSVRLERLRLGDPTQTIRLEVENVTTADAQVELEALRDALERAKAKQLPPAPEEVAARAG